MLVNHGTRLKSRIEQWEKFRAGWLGDSGWMIKRFLLAYTMVFVHWDTLIETDDHVTWQIEAWLRICVGGVEHDHERTVGLHDPYKKLMLTSCCTTERNVPKLHESWEEYSVSRLHALARMPNKDILNNLDILNELQVLSAYVLVQKIYTCFWRSFVCGLLYNTSPQLRYASFFHLVKMMRTGKRKPNTIQN